MKLIGKYTGLKSKTQKGFTLLEYCAGAAVIIGIAFAGMTALGEGVGDYFDALETWIRGNSAQLPAQTTTP